MSFGNRISILYVDDDPALLDLGKIFLEGSSIFDVDTVQSGKEALDILRQREYEGIISDYQMPEMDGIELLRIVRSRYPDLPFILFTGKGREDVVIQAFDAGADYYIQKGGEARSQFRELSHKIKRAVKKRQTEIALKTSEERYRNVVEDQTEFICRFRPDGTHDFVNDAYCRYFGLEKEDVIGHRFIPDIPEPDAGMICRHFGLLTRDNPLGVIEHRIIMPGGSVRWHQWSDRAIFDESGALVEYQSVGRDITDRKTAQFELMEKNEELHAAFEQLTAIEEELRSSYDDLAASQRTLEESEMTLRAVLEESPIPQFVIDRNHTILYWNHALASYSGVIPEEALGTDTQWKAFYTSRRPCLADLLLDGTLEKIPEWYEGKYVKSVLIDDAYEATDFFPRMGGEGKWLHFTAGLIRDRNGDVIGAVESLEDITARKNAELEVMKKNEEIGSAYEELTAIEEELRANVEELVTSQKALQTSEVRYRNIVEDQTEFICRFRPDGTHVFVNDAYCRYFAMNRDEIVGHRFRPILPRLDEEKLRVMLVTLTPENPVGYLRQRVIFPDGSIRWQNWVDRAIFDESGVLVEYQSVGRDITDIVLAEQAREESEQRYRNVVEDQTELISRFLPDGTHVFVNSAYCRYFNKKPDEIIGKKFIPDMPEEDRVRVIRHLASLTREHPVAAIAQRIIMPDGRIRRQQWSDRAIFDTSGRIIEYQSVGREIPGPDPDVAGCPPGDNLPDQEPRGSDRP
jgi:PAS domain S-box-containing protein